MKQNLIQRAKIRNARSCNLAESVAYEAFFNIERDNKGWDALENATLAGVSGGFLFLSALTNSPALFRATTFSFVDGSLYTEIALRFKYKKNRIDSIATKGKIQFTTASDSLFNSDKEIEFDLIADNEWHTYYINMGPISTWVGNITNLKIFFSTNGQFSDEVFLSFIKIQKPSYSFCNENCYTDSSTTIVGDNFDLYELNSQPINYSLANQSSNKIIKILNDPQSLVNKTVSLNNTAGAGNVGPTIVRSFNEIKTGQVSFRFLVTALEGKFTLISDLLTNKDLIELKIVSGILKYREGLSTFLNFQANSSIVINTWYSVLISFNGDTNKYSVYLNGLLVAEGLSTINIGNLSAIKFENPGDIIGNVYIDDLLVVEENTSSECVGLGQQGEAIGVELSTDTLTITKDINDKLIVNINNYGDAVIRLDPVQSASLLDVSFLLEKALASYDIGGYTYCEVLLKENKFIIRSGTYGFDSQVVVKKYLTSSLSEDLGFFENQYTSKIGRPHSSGFLFNNQFRAKTIDLNKLKETSVTEKLIQSVRNPSAEIGARFAGSTGREVIIEGINKTIIDYHHRGTEEGILKEVYFHGQLPQNPRVKVTGNSGQTSSTNLFNTNIFNINTYKIVTGDVLVIDTLGYAANGSYTIEAIGNTGVLKIKGATSLSPGLNLSFSIHNIPKVKQFRPNISGTLNLINEAEIGLSASGFLYTRTPDTHRIKVDWTIHRGDLIGIYNATQIYTGNDQNKSPDATYIEFEGDIVESTDVTEVKGQGIRGIGLYGKTLVLNNRALYDIELENKDYIDYIDISGYQVSEKVPYNICTAINNGLNLSVTITGTHSHISENNVGAKVETIHQNVAYNVAALTDGLQFASNGFLGTFQQNNSSASYFYISGDAEFAGYVYNEDGSLAQDSLEFPIAGSLVYQYTTGFQEDKFEFNYSWPVPKDIYKYKIFFKEFPNARGFHLEYLKNITQDFDGFRPGFEKIGTGNDSEFTKVSLDKIIIASGVVSGTEILRHHFDKDYVAYVNEVTQGRDDIKDIVQMLHTPQYTILEKEFLPVNTSAFNFICVHHESTKIAETELYGYTTSSSGIEPALELYFAIDDSTYEKAEKELLENGNVRFKIGYPTNTFRLQVEPDSEATLTNIYIKPSENKILYQNPITNKEVKILDIDIEKGQFSEPSIVSIKNNTGSIADCDIYVDVKELSSSIILKSTLNTESAVINPEIGPQGVLLQDKDNDLAITKNVAINSPCYGLLNLAENKKYYEAITVNSESDYFRSLIDVSIWDKVFTNFPSTAPTNIGLKYPGFSLAKDGVTYGPPTSPITARLITKWKPSNSFNATISCIYDARQANANPLGSAIGIIDSLGRRIYIKKERFLYNFSGNRSYADYTIQDSLLGVLDTKRSFCLNSFCGSIFGSEDDYTEYFLSVSRIKNTDIDLLRFTYTDLVNGKSEPEWDGNNYFEINLKTLGTPLSGDIKIFIENFWTKSSGTPIGTLGPENFFIRINSFIFGGESNLGSTYNFNSSPKFITTSGYIHESNASTVSPIKYIAVDLEKRYALDILDIYSNISGVQFWNQNLVQFSNSDTSNITEVTWGNSNKFDTRWLLYQVDSVPPTYTGTLKYLENLRIYPDITITAPGRIDNSEWENLGNILTDGNIATRISQVDYPVICVGLDTQFEVLNFKLLDDTGSEYKRNNQSNYKGWAETGKFTLSSSLTNNPKEIIWKNIWLDYLESNKTIVPLKWLGFKNETFIKTLPRSNELFCNSLNVETRGINFDEQEGQVNDRVDFTEYSNWFNVNYSYDNDILQIPEDQFGLQNILFGSNNLTESFNIESLGKEYYALDGRTETIAYIDTASANIWRLFGTPSGTTVTGEQSISGNTLGNIIFDNPITISSIQIIPTITQIDAFEVILPEEPTAVPDQIDFQTITGTDPTSDSSWQTVYSESGLFSTEQVSEFNNAPVFNNKERYLVRLNPPLLSSGIRFKFSNIQTLTSPVTSLGIQNLKTYQTFTQNNSNIVNITNDYSEHVGGSKSTKITYLANNAAAVKISLGGAIEFNPDSNWSIQDFLSGLYKAQNSELLDYENSFIRFGENPNIFYEWNLTSISGQLNSNFQQLDFRFLDAIRKSEGSIDSNFSDQGDLESKVDFINGPLTFFELELKPLGTAGSDIIIWLDNFNIKREKFTLPGKFANTLYLNNSELLYYPLSDFNIENGFFEAIITPDWSKTATRSVKKMEAFTIFSAINGEDESFSCWYDSNRGLIFAVSTLEVKTTFQAGYIKNLEKYKPFKLSVSWSANNILLDGAANTNIKVWINDIPAGEFFTDWTIKQSKDVLFFIGSRAYQSDVAINLATTYQFPLPSKFLPDVKSLHGGIENVLVANTNKKISFSDLKNLKDFIYISLDNITYYQASSSNLPITLNNISNGDTIEIYVKTNLPIDTFNLTRDAVLRTRWRVI